MLLGVGVLNIQINGVQSVNVFEDAIGSRSFLPDWSPRFSSLLVAIKEAVDVSVFTFSRRRRTGRLTERVGSLRICPRYLVNPDFRFSMVLLLADSSVFDGKESFFASEGNFPSSYKLNQHKAGELASRRFPNKKGAHSIQFRRVTVFCVS